MKKFKFYDPEEGCVLTVQTIKNICAVRGMSQHILAQRACVSESTLSNIFNNHHYPGLYTLFKLCNALEIPLEQVLPIQTEKQEVFLTLKEKQLLNYYRNLPEGEKELFFNKIKKK